MFEAQRDGEERVLLCSTNFSPLLVVSTSPLSPPQTSRCNHLFMKKPQYDSRSNQLATSREMLFLTLCFFYFI